MVQIETPEQQIERLSAQVAQLQARLETAPPSTPAAHGPTRASLRLRAFSAALLIAVGVVLAPVAVVAAWTKTEVTDTGRFVATLSPLVDDPAFQAVLVDQITTVIDDQIDFEAIATDLFDGIAQLNLPPRAQAALGLLKQPAVEGARSLVRTATQRLIASDAFANIWEQTLRVSHSQVIAALQGDTSGPLTIGAQGEVGIQLAPLVAAVKSALVAQGFALADRIPEINRTIQVAQSDALVQARVAYQILDVLGFVLPWASLVLLAAGVVVARRKARALIGAGLLLALSMAVLATGISVGRILFAGSVSPQYLPRDAALATYDAIVPFISATALAVGTAGVTVAVVAYLAGPFRGAIVVRRLTVDSASNIRSSAERRGGTTGAFGVWLYSVRRYARVVVALVAAAVVLFVRPLSPGVIIGTAVTALVAILLVELLQRPPADGVAASLKPSTVNVESTDESTGESTGESTAETPGPRDLSPASVSRPPVATRRARIAVGVLFFTNGAIFANLLPRYPQIKVDLGLTNAEFGFAVAAYPLGALIAGLTAGLLVRRFRSSRVAIVATVFTAVGILLAGVAPAWLPLAAGLFLAGAMDSITDVAQNSHALRVQRLYKRSILNSFHAVWSIGAVSGGALGSLAAGLGMPVAIHLALSAVLFSLLAVLSYRTLLPGPEPEEVRAAAVPTGVQTRAGRAGGVLAKYAVLLALVLIAAAGALVEDAGSSWSAIYLSVDLGASAFVAGLGFIALQGMQFVGRMLGDRLVDRFGQRAVARTGGVIVCAGMGSALLVPSVLGTVVGFGLAGLGVATLIPAAMHAADELPGFRPGSGLTILAWLLRVGFLVSPPVVGAIADASSLRLGLLVVPVAGALALLFAGVLSGRAPQAPAADFLLAPK